MITPEQLQQHVAWLKNAGGQRIEQVNADLSEADLSEAILSRAILSRADLSWADLRWADLSGSDLHVADLRGSSLRGADLRGSSLRGADLSGSNLRGAILSGSDLRGAILSGSDLRGSSLRGAIGNMREIKSAQFDTWSITWSADVLAIGCQQHAIEKWRNADPKWIAAMDSNASNWWSHYGTLVLQLIDASPAAGVVLEAA